jgi:hypothetical protein
MKLRQLRQVPGDRLAERLTLVLAGPGHQREDDRRAAGKDDRGDVLQLFHAIDCGARNTTPAEGQLKRS